jgi:plastocyanin
MYRKLCATGAALLTLTACAPASTSAPPARAATRPTTTEATAEADCSKATKLTITGANAFSPARLTIRRGGVLSVTNKSGKVHALATTPDAGIGTTVLDLKEHQFVQFLKAGTFTVEGAGATVQVKVAGESGCGAPKPTLTLTAGGAVSPARLSVVAAENFTVVNKSGVTRTVRCTPDPGSNKDNTRLEKGESQILAIDEPGRYTCGKATITVTDR